MTEKSRRNQYAALPYTVVDGSTRVMLVTSRDTGRWIVPKGWPGKKTKPCDQAAREAYEEAGALGRIDKKPFGSFSYDKRLRKRTVTCLVDVFLLKVERELDEWPESKQRSRKWMSPAEAIHLVDNIGLAGLLRRLSAPPDNTPAVREMSDPDASRG